MRKLNLMQTKQVVSKICFDLKYKYSVTNYIFNCKYLAEKNSSDDSYDVDSKSGEFFYSERFLSPGDKNLYFCMRNENRLCYEVTKICILYIHQVIK